MKKSVLVLILLIYVASIVVIGFFGVQIGTFNVTLYVQDIELLNEDVFINDNDTEDYKEDDEYFISIFFQPYENEQDNPNYVQLMYKVYPEDATYRGVTFVHAENSKATVNGIGTVIFTGKTTLTIYITSTDGTNVRQKVNVVAR